MPRGLHPSPSHHEPLTTDILVNISCVGIYLDIKDQMLITERQQPTADMSTLAPSPPPWVNGAQRVHSNLYEYELSPQWSATDIQPYELTSTPASSPPSLKHPYDDYVSADISMPGSQRHGARTDNANGFDGWRPAHTAESWEFPTPVEMGWRFERWSPPDIPPTSPISIPVPEVNYAPGIAPLDVLQQTKSIVDSVWAIAVAALQREADTRRQLEALLKAQAAPRGNRPTSARGTQVNSEQHKDEDGQERAKESTRVGKQMKSSVWDDEIKAPAARQTKAHFDVKSLQRSDKETKAPEEDEARGFVYLVTTFEEFIKTFEEERAQEHAVLEDEKAKLAEEKAKVEQEKAKVEQEKETVEQEKAKIKQEKGENDQESIEDQADEMWHAEMKQRIVDWETALAKKIKACMGREKCLVQDKGVMEEETQFEAENKILHAMLSQKLRYVKKHQPSGAAWRMSQNVRTSANWSKEDITEAEETESREESKKAREEKKKADEAWDPADATKNRAETEWQSLRNCFEHHEDGKPSLAGVRLAFEAFRIRAQARRGKAGIEAQETTTEAHAQGPN